MPIMGGSKPDLRLSESGKLMLGTGKTVIPLNCSLAFLATPTSSAMSR